MKISVEDNCKSDIKDLYASLTSHKPLNYCGNLFFESINQQRVDHWVYALKIKLWESTSLLCGIIIALHIAYYFQTELFTFKPVICFHAVGAPQRQALLQSQYGNDYKIPEHILYMSVSNLRIEGTLIQRRKICNAFV